jgi:hypothetical protein
VFTVHCVRPDDAGAVEIVFFDEREARQYAQDRSRDWRVLARERLMSAPWSRRVWDTRAVYVEKRQRWWWNAWRASTATELYGFTDSQAEATQAMYRAIEQAGPSPTSDVPRTR